MRVTNNMIMKNASSNINKTKEMVNERNTQMTTQKKISRPSDDPVIAVRSLRLSTSLSQVNQYYEKNIPDATSWLDVTETALINMRSITSDCRTLAVKGSTGSLSQEDRKTILNQLESLQSQLYAEGNADYAGRTVFTGFRTDSNLVFTENEVNTKYTITQTVSASDAIAEHRYYDGNVEVPTTEDAILNNDISDIAQTDYYRIRAAYNAIDEGKVNSFSYTYTNENKEVITATYDMATKTWSAEGVDADGNPLAVAPAAPTFGEIKLFANEDEWAADSHANPGDPLGKTVDDDGIVFIAKTGEFVLGKNVTKEFMTNNVNITFEYEKTGFKTGELRPEYYYDCVKNYDPNDVHTDVVYKKFDENGLPKNYDINYAVAQDQTVAVNTEASNVFDSSLQRDLGEMIDAVNAALSAHDKYDTIKSMMGEAQYASEADQERLGKWLDAAKKEADYADENLKKMYESEIGKIDIYYGKINLALTDLGCKMDSLKLTETRMCNQQETISELQSQNDDIDLSKIIIDYTAAYTAYQSSLVAAGKLGEVSLLNYI